MYNEFISLFTFDKNVTYIIAAYVVVLGGMVTQGVISYQRLKQQLRSKINE